jgi:KRAB domain-containing zinc finger protein
MGTHTREQPYKCKYQCYFCSKAAKCKSELTWHMGTHTREKPYKCKWCLKSFRSPYCCKHHIEQNSCLKAQMRILHNGEIKRYQCYFCSKPARCKSELTSHLGMHTREKPYKCKRKPNLCYFCDQGFTTDSKLYLHVSRVHTKENSCFQVMLIFYKKNYSVGHKIAVLVFEGKQRIVL